MRYLLFIIAISAAAQTWPSQLSGLSSNTGVITPETPAKPAPGGTYTDPVRGTTITRLPAPSPTCSTYAWVASATYWYPEVGVSYNGGYYYVPWEAGHRGKAQFTKTTTAGTTSGRVLTFSSTAPTNADSRQGGLEAGFGFTVAGTNIPATATVVSFDATTVTLSEDVTGGGVAAGATITFTNPPTMAPWVQSSLADVCARGGRIPSYSQRQAWNSDGTKVLVIGRQPKLRPIIYSYANGVFTFLRELDGGTSLQRDVQFHMALNNSSETWSHTDPNIIYLFYFPNQFVSYNVVTDEVTVLYTFTSGTGDQYDCPSSNYAVQNGGGGNPDVTDRYWAAYCKSDDGWKRRMIVYDKTLNQVVSKKDVVTACGSLKEIDWMGMSPTGAHVVVSWNHWSFEEEWTTCTGVESFSRVGLNSEGMLRSNSGHDDVGFDVDGNEVLVSGNYAHRRLNETNNMLHSMYITKFSDVHPPPYTRQTSYVKTQLLPCSWVLPITGPDPYTGCDMDGAWFPLNFHISGRAEQRPGYWLMTSFLDEDPTLTPLPEKVGWGRYEAIALQIDTKLADMAPMPFKLIARDFGYRAHQTQTPQCTVNEDYFQEPHGTVNQDFSAILFGSSWSQHCGSSSAYSVYLGAAAPGPTITTTILPAGAVGAAYSQALAATGGTQPYSWAVTGGTLCGGLALSAGGTISGTPTTAQTCSFTVTVTDDAAATDDQALSITISAGGGGGTGISRAVSGNVRISGKVQ